MKKSKEVLYLGLDVHAESIAVALAEAGRDGEVRNYGEIPNTFHSIDKLLRKLGHPDKELRVCYEAGPGKAELPSSFRTPKRFASPCPIKRHTKPCPR